MTTIETPTQPKMLPTRMPDLCSHYSSFGPDAVERIKAIEREWTELCHRVPSRHVLPPEAGKSAGDSAGYYSWICQRIEMYSYALTSNNLQRRHDAGMALERLQPERDRIEAAIRELAKRLLAEFDLLAAKPLEAERLRIAQSNMPARTKELLLTHATGLSAELSSRRREVEKLTA